MSAPGVPSVIKDYGESCSSCGYCGSKRPTSCTHGMMAESLSVEAYQALLDRGWRRSGRWVYFPLHERSCCQLLTIRLDVTRFAPNKEQRRVQRKWRAYLEGAPLRPEAQQQQQQQEVQPGEAAASGSPRALAGGSPKRPHDDMADSLLWEQQQEQSSSAEGGGKRHRLGTAGLGETDEARGASPTAQLREHLQQALWSTTLPAKGVDVEDGQPQQRQQPPPQQQQQPAASAPLAAEAATSEVPLDAKIAAALSAALQQGVSRGLLPPAAYGAPKVQQPTAKQRKLLPAAVTFTTAFPLAVAAVVSKAAGSTGGAKPDPEAVAALLMQQLPAHLAAAAEVAKGHLNFALPISPGTAAAAAAAAVGAAGAAAPAAATAGGGVEAAPGTAAGPAAHQPAAPPPSAAAHAAASAATAGAATAPIPRGVPRHFELRMLRSDEPSLAQVEFQLYKKYQVVHHGDKPSEVSPASFKRFLCDTPLQWEGPAQHPAGGCPSSGFGSFHQQYWLDGRLVAVGVVDVLPRCLSSKYLFWDPDLAPLSLGKLTSLAEIGWVREEGARCPALRYYYLGFYIHNCHRMHYKGDFAPADLLCPKSKCWVPLERVRPALDQAGMVAISEVPGALEGLGAEHLVDPSTHTPSCPPRQPTQAELDSCKLLIAVGRASGGPQAQVVTLGLLRRAGLLLPGADQGLVGPLRLWWSRAGPTAAPMIAVFQSG